MLGTLPFKKVDPKVLEHPVERRGFVSVPFDYSDPKGQKIDLFYRLIPAHGSKPDDRSKPVIVVINGGPGIPSSTYRPLDYDYQNLDSPKNGPLDRFRHVLHTHRVLIVDQRGTDGQSAPLDFDFPGGPNPNLVAKYFSSDSHARDYLAVMNEVIPQGDPFFIIAQSYGGMPGMQYLALSNARSPSGIIFSCSALPYEDTTDQMLSRRREQLELNRQLRKAVPDIEQRLEKVREHLAKIGADPLRIHGLYTFLGKDIAGKWEKDFVQRLDQILKQDLNQFEKDPATQMGTVKLLNYILSSANFTPGTTDRLLARFSSEKIRFEPWMIDENQLYLQAGQDGTWRAGYVDAIDRKPPAPTPFPSLEKLKAAIGKTRVLFAAADNDAYVPADSYLRAVEKFQVAGHTEVRRLPGGHHAIFLKSGHEAILELGFR